MFDIRPSSAPTSGTVIPALSGFHAISFSFRDDQKISRKNITAGIVSRPIIGFVVRDGAASPVTYPAMEAGEINAMLIPSGAVIEGGDAVHDSLENFLVSLLHRGMSMRAQPPAGNLAVAVLRRT